MSVGRWNIPSRYISELVVTMRKALTASRRHLTCDTACLQVFWLVVVEFMHTSSLVFSSQCALMSRAGATLLGRSTGDYRLHFPLSVVMHDLTTSQSRRLATANFVRVSRSTSQSLGEEYEPTQRHV